MLKYTTLRSQLGIASDKAALSDHAYLTHYFHSGGNGDSYLFKEPSIEYVLSILEENNLIADHLFQPRLPIEWDIPFAPPKNHKFRFIDLFAGIGGFRLAFQELGGKCVFSSEWDFFARKTYEMNYGEVPFGDIREISTNMIPDHDILVAGFPCQPFSIAGVSKKNALGKHHGFKDETQGTLFFDIARIIAEKQPAAFLLENVKNLISHDKGNTFKVISNALDEVGYNIEYKILDGQHYVPQHRERIVIVGFQKSNKKAISTFKFPTLPNVNLKIQDILEDCVDDKYTLTNKLWQYLQNYAQKHKEKGNGFGFGLVDLNGVTRTLSARYYKDGSEILIPQIGKNPRRLTPRECARLQGYPDKFIIPVSDNQAYRQFGNSVVVPLMKSVGNKIIKALKSNDI
ncbi:MAG: DNA (cytosine-5-)-methyltransferase [Chlorobi bacterium]|nr:DNA (cytosine-5-)-methyltransferase [Chlorobiota bacterium]MBX7215758.1 DNA (cytosine-5-)-methyltransferase [Candidatus Kapabacteria bacterium]